MLLFSSGKVESIQTLRSVIDEFSNVSGLQLNDSKSVMFCARMDDFAKDLATEAMGIPLGELLFTYLGVPICSKRPSSADFRLLIDKLTRRVQSWTAKHLSYAGRLEITRVVLYGIYNFWAKVFLLPKKVFTEINSILRSYLWGGNDSNRKAPIAWATVCRPKNEGGLGLKEVLSWNKANMGQLLF